MGYLLNTKICIIFSAVFLLCIGSLALKIHFLNASIDKKNLEIKSIALDLNTSKQNLKAANSVIESQNEAISKMSVKVEQKPIKEVKRVEKIYLKDESCEAKLKAYQELFFDFADEQSSSLRPTPSVGSRTKDVSDFADKVRGER